MSNAQKIILGTRGSALARAQTTIVGNLLQKNDPQLHLEQKIISTRGDAEPTLSLHEPTAEGSGLFTRQLEEALLAHEIDLAVHSLKDLPVITPHGLLLAAILPRATTADLLITRLPNGLNALPPGAIVATSSPRRTALLKGDRPDLRFLPIRGNIPTRLSKLISHQPPLAALVLARAGLERLGYDLQLQEGVGSFLLEQTRLYVTELTQMLPAPGQGAIVVETRDEAGPLSTYLQPLHDPQTASCVTAERLLLRYLGGGCHMSLGALASVDETTGELELQAVYQPSPSSPLRHGKATGRTPEEVALRVATQLGDKLALL